MMFLEKEEIDRLTGKKQRRTQMQVLDAMGITYFVNGIDELVVSRRHVEDKLGAAVEQLITNQITLQRGRHHTANDF